MESSSESRVVTEAAPPWRVLQVNSEWCSVTGYTEAQWLGNTCRILQGPETCQRTVHVLNDALRAQRQITVRMVNYRADRTPFVNDLTIVPMPQRAAPGAATHFVASCATTRCSKRYRGRSLRRRARVCLRRTRCRRCRPSCCTPQIGRASCRERV